MLGSALAGAATTADEILERYFVIHNRLADDSLEGVTEAAAKIAEISRRASKTESAGRDKLLALSASASKLKATDLNTARENFGDLSKNLTAWLQQSGAQEKAYQLYCPMAKKGWLQRDKKVRNPYYGKSMLTCGELVE
jgi:hypothetical protein